MSHRLKDWKDYPQHYADILIHFVSGNTDDIKFVMSRGQTTNLQLRWQRFISAFKRDMKGPKDVAALLYDKGMDEWDVNRKVRQISFYSHKLPGGMYELTFTVNDPTGAIVQAAIQKTKEKA